MEFVEGLPDFIQRRARERHFYFFFPLFSFISIVLVYCNVALVRPDNPDFALLLLYVRYSMIPMLPTRTFGAFCFHSAKK